MDATKGNCRNCGSGDVKELGFIGEVAPFFLKRVLNAEMRTSISRHPLRLLARRVCSLPNVLFEKVYGSRAYIEMQICLTCSFIQVKHPFRDEDIGRLYADYRTQSYNEERIHYEPTYAPIANDVGKAEKEMACRVDGLTTWLQGKIDTAGDFSMLDFGGSDGRFLPRMSGKKYVYEISNTQPLPGIVACRERSRFRDLFLHPDRPCSGTRHGTVETPEACCKVYETERKSLHRGATGSPGPGPCQPEERLQPPPGPARPRTHQLLLRFVD